MGSDDSRDVLHSAEMARRILWTDRDLPLKDYHYQSVSYCTSFSHISFHITSHCPLTALLIPAFYTNLYHESLSAVIPRSRVHAIRTFLFHLFRTILHP